MAVLCFAGGSAVRPPDLARLSPLLVHDFLLRLGRSSPSSFTTTHTRRKIERQAEGSMNSHTSLGIAQIVFYVPATFYTHYVGIRCWKYGPKMAWYPLMMFALGQSHVLAHQYGDSLTSERSATCRRCSGHPLPARSRKHFLN